MKQFAEKFFSNQDVKVASLHKPPLIEINTKDYIEPPIENLSEFWFYPASGEPHKNHHILIDLCKKAISLGLEPRILVTIADNSGYGKKFLQDINSNQLNEFIVNIGWVSGPLKYKLYKDCRGLLFLSAFESLGIPLLEARHLQLKILCSKSGISDEVLGKNYPKFDLSKEDDLLLLIKTFSNSLPFDYRHKGKLSDGILQSYFINFLQ
jgi:hypothetical protein